MSILTVHDGPPVWAQALFDAGRSFVKQAEEVSAPEVAYNLAGTLYLASNGWLLLSVSNAFVHGIFANMHEPGIELPPGKEPGSKMNAHITVMKPKEIELIGGADKINERGKQFHYTLGRLYSTDPAGWPEMSKVWFVRVHSPELQFLRRSYGLSGLPNEGKYDFHITVAVRRKGVLAASETRKGEVA